MLALLYGAIAEMATCLADLLYPRACAGCSAWDYDVCPDCAALFAPQWRSVADHARFLLLVDGSTGQVAPAAPVYAMLEYSGRVRNAIVTWKHSHQASLTRAIVRLWTRGLQDFGGVLEPSPDPQQIVVPVPSKWKRAHDGRLVVRELAAAVAHQFGIPIVDALRARPPWLLAIAGYRSQSLGWFDLLAALMKDGLRRVKGFLRPGRYQSARFDERRAKREAVSAKISLAGKRVILVDDVVASGATLEGAIRALENAGASVDFVLTLAAPPAKTSSNGAALS